MITMAAPRIPGATFGYCANAEEVQDMEYIWRDYDPETMGFVESWPDEAAVRSTGLEDGFRDFYEYWAREDGFVVGENYWCKVVFEDDHPFAVIALALYEGKVTVMEMVVDPTKRGQGKGAKMLKELLDGIAAAHS